MQHIIRGQVIHGFDKGKSMGFPTFNLALEEKYPLDKLLGIWFSHTYYQDRKLPSITHIGPVRIFNEKNIRVETHILNWDEDLYGADLQVELLHKLRDTRDFIDETELVRQVMEDIREAKVYFKLI